MPGYVGNNVEWGVYSNPYARVPSTPQLYTQYMNQYYPNWKQGAFQGQAYPVQPGQYDPNVPAGGGQDYRSQLFSNNPLQIQGSDAYQRLMQLATGGAGSVNLAQNTMQPALDYLKGIVDNPAPLGSGRGELVQQQGTQAIDTAGSTARRMIGEDASRMGGASNPAATSFMKAQNRVAQAAAYGPGAVAPGQQVDLAEKQANEQFRAAASDMMKSMGLGLGGLNAQDASLQTQAAISAGQLMSFAYNTWADILSRLMSGGSGVQYTVEDKGLARGAQGDAMRNALSQQGYYNWPTFPQFQY